MALQECTLSISSMYDNKFKTLHSVVRHANVAFLRIKLNQNNPDDNVKKTLTRMLCITTNRNQSESLESPEPDNAISNPILRLPACRRRPAETWRQCVLRMLKEEYYINIVQKLEEEDSDINSENELYAVTKNFVRSTTLRRNSNSNLLNFFNCCIPMAAIILLI